MVGKKIAGSLLILFLTASCGKHNCTYETALKKAKGAVKNKIDVDLYSVSDSIVEDNYFVFKLKPPKGGTGFSPVIQVKKQNCEVKIIDWV